MKTAKVEEGHYIYLCPKHYETKEKILELYRFEHEKFLKTVKKR